MSDPAPDFTALREQGRHDAVEAAEERAPSHPLERVAWAAGWGQEDQLRAAVQTARAAGTTWRAIAEALGEHEATVETKYGRGYERQRAYRERRRQQGDEG